MRLVPSKLFLLATLLALASCRDAKIHSKQDPIPKTTSGETEPAPTEREPAADSVLSPEQRESLTGVEAFASEEYLQGFVQTRDSIHWYGFYLGGNKAGYAKVEMRKARADEPGDFLLGMTVHVDADGESMQMDRFAYYEDVPPFRAVALQVREQGNMGRTEHNFVRDGERTRVDSTIDGRKMPTRWGPEMCNALAGAVAELAPDIKNITTASRARVCSFSEDELKQEIEEIRVESIGKRRVGGVELAVATLGTRSGDSKQWINATIADHGTTLEVSLGPGVSLKIEDKDVAQSDIVGVDIGTLAVKVDALLPDPTTIKELELKANFAEGFVPPPSAPNQRVEKLDDNVYRLTIRAVPGARVDAKDREEALRATTDVNFDDPAIMAMAKTITRGAKSTKEKVALLNHWVYVNLDKSLSTNLSTASQVLEHRTGDCTEHTLLLLALLRSLDIPARELSGLVYLDGEFSAFGWHAWTEVEIEGHWVQVDPSWDEVVANATHLSLGAEDGHMNMGAIKLEVLTPPSGATWADRPRKQ